MTRGLTEISETLGEQELEINEKFTPDSKRNED